MNKSQILTGSKKTNHHSQLRKHKSFYPTEVKVPSVLQLHTVQQTPSIKSRSVVRLHVFHIATTFVLHLASLYHLWKWRNGGIAAWAVERSNGEAFLLRVYHGPVFNASKPPIAQNL